MFRELRYVKPINLALAARGTGDATNWQNYYLSSNVS